MSEAAEVDEGLDGFVLPVSEHEASRSRDALGRQHVRDLVVGRIWRRPELAVNHQTLFEGADERDNALEVHGARARQDVAEPMNGSEPLSKPVDRLLGRRGRHDHLKGPSAVLVVQDVVEEEAAEVEALRWRHWLAGFAR